MCAFVNVHACHALARSELCGYVCVHACVCMCVCVCSRVCVCMFVGLDACIVLLFKCVRTCVAGLCWCACLCLGLLWEFVPVLWFGFVRFCLLFSVRKRYVRVAESLKLLW